VVGLNILWFVLILMGLVLVHEAGHMVVAKWCGMRVERFSIFFGRPLWKFTRGETEYAIGWIPLGGYVKISGMTQGEELDPAVAPRAYSNMPVWRRVVTILAGPAVNIVLAILLFAAIFWIGVPTANLNNTVGTVTPDSAAQTAGLKPGDRLVAIDGGPHERRRRPGADRVARQRPGRHGAHHRRTRRPHDPTRRHAGAPA